MIADPTVLLRRFGTDEPVPPARVLRAGELTARFVGGGLRDIRWGALEIIRAIAFVVRDRNWSTYDPVLETCDISGGADAFRVTYRARCSDGETGQSLRFDVAIDGRADGFLRFEATAVPETDFVTARCGFAVLHPLDGVVGQRAAIEHVDGSVEQTVFPALIEPWQPFKDVRAITHHPAPSLAVRCLLEGDVFETEDQRAWSDASFKTYVRPLALPWPYTLQAGEPVQQAVTLQVTGETPPIRDASSDAIGVVLGTERGHMPAIGLVLHPAEIADALAHPELLQALSPQLLLFHFDPLAGHGRADLARFAELAGRERTRDGAIRVELEIAVPGRAAPREELAAIGRDVEASGLAPDGVMVCPSVDRQSTTPGSSWPDCPPLEAVYEAARAVFPGIRLTGGMLSYFTELNRKRPPLGLLDAVSFCTCPIVHAADDVSVMQTLETLPHILHSARAIIGELACRVGPSTIGMRQNPYGARLTPNPRGGRVTMTDRDPRQRGTFGAAWLLGYAAATENAFLEALIPAALAGPLGLASVGESGRVVRHPAFAVVELLSRLAGRPRLACATSAPGRLAALSVQGKDGVELLLANLTDEQVNVALPQCASWKLHALIDDMGEMHDLNCALPEERMRLGSFTVAALRAG